MGTVAAIEPCPAAAAQACRRSGEARGGTQSPSLLTSSSELPDSSGSAIAGACLRLRGGIAAAWRRLLPLQSGARRWSLALLMGNGGAAESNDATKGVTSLAAACTAGARHGHRRDELPHRAVRPAAGALDILNVTSSTPVPHLQAACSRAAPEWQRSALEQPWHCHRQPLVPCRPHEQPSWRRSAPPCGPAAAAAGGAPWWCAAAARQAPQAPRSCPAPACCA